MLIFSVHRYSDVLETKIKKGAFIPKRLCCKNVRNKLRLSICNSSYFDGLFLFELFLFSHA